VATQSEKVEMKTITDFIHSCLSDDESPEWNLSQISPWITRTKEGYMFEVRTEQSTYEVVIKEL